MSAKENLLLKYELIMVMNLYSFKQRVYDKNISQIIYYQTL